MSTVAIKSMSSMRRNFYRIVVGPTGVALAEEVDRLDASTTAKQLEITAEKKALEQHVPNGMKLDASEASRGCRHRQKDRQGDEDA